MASDTSLVQKMEEAQMTTCPGHFSTHSFLGTYRKQYRDKKPLRRRASSFYIIYKCEVTDNTTITQTRLFLWFYDHITCVYILFAALAHFLFVYLQNNSSNYSKLEGILISAIIVFL